MSGTLLQLHNVGFSYEDSAFALRGVSLAVRAGERVAVLGSNGAGKSTFFLLCNGVHQPQEGAISYAGAPITSKKRDLMLLREKVGIVFQDPNQQLIGSTVAGEISFGPMNLALPKDEVTRRVEDAMAAMQLTQFRERPPHCLSGGEKKRVSIADVLAMNSEVILFDEPTASLDPAGVQMLEGVLADLTADGKTLLVSTHDIDFAWRWATRALVFADGRLVADSAPETIFADDGLLEQAGLRRPYLYDAALALRKADPSLFPCGLPKTAGEFRTGLERSAGISAPKASNQ